MADYGVRVQASHSRNMGSEMDTLARVSSEGDRCFGRMKKKFRILAVPMMRRNEIDCANIVKVCACLHNVAFQGTVAADRNVDWRQVEWTR